MGGWFAKLISRFANRAAVHEVRGFRVVVENNRADIATEDVLERLGEALYLIARYQPCRLAHLRRDVT